MPNGDTFQPDATNVMTLSLQSHRCAPWLAVLVLAGCGDHAQGDGARVTMVPTPIEGFSATEPRAGADCARYGACCLQALPLVPPSLAPTVQAQCTQLASATESAPGQQACATGMAQLAAQLRAAGVVVPDACGTETLAPRGLFSGSSLFGGAGGRGMITIGSAQTGVFAIGDPAEPDGSLYHDLSIVLTAGVPVTLIARGGAVPGSPTGSGAATLDMYLYLRLNGADVATDDDSAGGLNSRIVYTPTTSGVYVIRVSTFGAGPRYGAFTLQTYAGALPSQT